MWVVLAVCATMSLLATVLVVAASMLSSRLSRHEDVNIDAEVQELGRRQSEPGNSLNPSQQST